LAPFSFRRILAWAFLGRSCLPERQSLARGVEAAELIFHVSDIGENARDAPARWRGIVLLAEICIRYPVLALMP